ncbi:MAG TPA: DUF1761 domain-containing protein [Xanthobacteraceae bacterium]|jgi:hypothetical protein|nr:DUF1761 domain-containing protein [Xanthobacteraceae bacterium]
MTFAGLNYLAILIAAIVAWVAGAVWYMSLGKIWTAAQGMTPEQMHANRNRPGAYLPFIYVFLAELVMAWVLAGLMGHLGAGQVTLVNGVISGAFCWLGFVITTLVPNVTFSMRDKRLIWIDGGHWLIVLALMGAIIGLMGV